MYIGVAVVPGNGTPLANGEEVRGEIIFAGTPNEARKDAAVVRVIEGTPALPA